MTKGKNLFNGTVLLAALGTSGWAAAQAPDPAAAAPDEAPPTQPLPPDEPSPPGQASEEEAVADPAPADAPAEQSVEPAAQPSTEGTVAAVAGQQPPQQAEQRVDLAKGQEGQDKKKKRKKDWKKQANISMGGLIRAGFVWQKQAPKTPSTEFLLRNARVELKWRQSKKLRGVVEAELSDREDSIAEWAPLRDAYVRFRPIKELQVQVGQFKKPFGRLKQLTMRRLPLIERGVADSWIVTDLGYGDRDLGLELGGEFGGKDNNVQYAVGVFNGTGRNVPEDDLNGAKDLTARVEVNPTGWLSAGINGSLKRFDQSVRIDFPSSGIMGGLDLAVKTQGLLLLAEGMFGQNYLSREEANSWSALLLASYKIPISPWWDLALEPLVKGEIMKAEDVIVDAHVWSATAGANLHIGPYFRWMVQGELTRTARNTPDLWQDNNRLFLIASLATR
ncbi:porin [Myxococcota bacterium]